MFTLCLMRWQVKPILIVYRGYTMNISKFQTLSKKGNRQKLLCGLVAGLFVSSQVQAMTLEEAFSLGLLHDSKFQGAGYEKNSNMSQAYQGWSAYLPTYSWQQQQNSFDASTRTNQIISQPIFDMGAIASVAQGSARKEFSEVTYQTRVQDLATRTLQAVNQLISVRETLRNNDSRLAAYQLQFKSVTRLYDLGQGTVTDVRDAQVKLNQAKADDLNLKAQKRTAELQVAVISGQMPTDNDFNLPRDYLEMPLAPLESIGILVKDKNPQILAARANEKISKYEVARASASILPTVGYSNVKSDYLGSSTINNGLTINIPLNIGGVIGTYGAAEKYYQSKYQTRDAEIQANLQTEQTYLQIESGYNLLKVRKLAIEAAEQSVEANQKSFTAGVKTSLDVLNSIQTLFQAKNDYVTALTQQSQLYLNLKLLAAEDPQTSIGQVQKMMFLY